MSTLHVSLKRNEILDQYSQWDVFRCCYKLVRERFKWFGLQGRVESLIMSQEERLFRNFHRQLFCWMDEWYGLTMQDIRRLEAATADDLKNELEHGQKKGMTTDE